ncbi:MAG TPA: DNA helicase PriA [Flavobacteriaceae bacterium]|nr:DNA helicase PriA [Flavobacteriaceae bacterium]MCB9212784.1 DNA helicase PriA [Alteromonas sp.]HPF10050.1 DNA helicase PriA [Flavobacteriaceae bacterium]HQU21349.1 DNA helicase PriA [Flavobacteriaceae bacterium]HQU63867.1 DNA helicase PriA [Flavobacteriaceae bacterium]
MEETKEQKSELKKACVNCGAELLYAPGTTELKCEYCGYTQNIPLSESQFEELELQPYLETLGTQSHSQAITMLQCKSCGANQHIEENYKSLHCVYCNSPLIIEDAYKEEWILPGAVLPFQITQQKAHLVFQKWVKGLWWAPNKLKKASLDPQNTKGLYSPYWTFDAQLFANYSGQRGDYYYVTVPYTTTVNGKTVTRTRQERRTRWTPVSGSISGFVDDTLIKASEQQSGRIPPKVAHWNLKELKPFDSSYLAGFVTEKYTISLKEGHLESTQEARKIAERWACRDIGGDTQRVTSLDMKLTNETFKHILLPVYISAYRYNGKRYNFFVNGQTGAIAGQRPYSFWKIFFFVLFILAVLGTIIYLANQ